MQITDLQGTVRLHNGVDMPYFGLGVFKIGDGKTVIDACLAALECGYRHIDTAALYGNKIGVGEAIRTCGIDRSSIFVTSKVWNTDQGYESTLKAFEQSLKRLGLDYMDLYLIHWPKKGLYKDTWKAMEKLYAEGLIKAIGVSNFLQHHLEDLQDSAEIKPMVNQMEFSPRLVQQDLVDYCAENQIQYEAWSPLMQGKVFEIPELKLLAEKYNKSVAQLVLRWNLQKGVVTIPKSENPLRIAENAAIFDFELSAKHVRSIDSLDQGHRVGADPDNFNF